MLMIARHAHNTPTTINSVAGTTAARPIRRRARPGISRHRGGRRRTDRRGSSTWEPRDSVGNQAEAVAAGERPRPLRNDSSIRNAQPTTVPPACSTS